MKRLFLLGAATLLAFVTPAEGSFDAYLLLEKDGPIPTDATHSWVTVLGFSQAVASNPTTGSTGDDTDSAIIEGKEATIQLAPDQSIARMMRGLALGESFTLTIHLVRPAVGETRASVMTQFVYRNAYFTKVKAAGSRGDQEAGFSISFLYRSLEYTQTLIDSQGTPISPTSAGWNFALNSEVIVPDEIPRLGDYDSGGNPPPPPNPDRDGDLIPNTWETTYNFNPDNPSDATGDPDKDGFNNREEFIAGTHPRQANSFFRTHMTELASTPGVQVEFNWSAIRNRTYVIEASNRPDGGFSPIHSITTSSDGPQTYRPPADAGPYFRLSVRE